MKRTNPAELVDDTQDKGDPAISILTRPNVAGDGLRFIVAGALNTGITVIAYQALLFHVSSASAYALSWVIGLLFAAIIYPNRVFVGGRTDGVARAVLAAFYVAIFLMGLALIAALDAIGSPPRLAIFLVVCCTTLLNFLGSRFLLRRR